MLVKPVFSEGETARK